MRVDFINPLFAELGWDVTNHGNRSEAYRDVVTEGRIRSGDGLKAPDYLFRIDGTPAFVLEAKKPSVNLRSDPLPAHGIHFFEAGHGRGDDQPRGREAGRVHRVHDRRGTKGMDAAGVLPEFTGIAVHDAWAPYDTYTAATHALCGAHVLRELQAVTDLAEQSAEQSAEDDRWCWATQAGDALRELNKLVADALAGSDIDDTGTLTGIDPAALADAIHRYRSAALLGMAATIAVIRLDHSA